MNKTQNKITNDTPRANQPVSRRHPVTLDNPKDVMFARMATVKERITAFEEKLNADRKKNTR